jgi:2-oxo-4-hydroxy-4-carboxy-5-ureidoimidazoline decarboxylase
MRITLSALNICPARQFVAVCGSLFEHSPWIAERTAAGRPFATREALHNALCATVRSAAADEQLALVRAHPDLFAPAALEGTLTLESQQEQALAGLGDVTADELRRFAEYNRQYRGKFGFPFVICARENKKESILAAFPVRLQNSPSTELGTALVEISKIARLRLLDAVGEGEAT